jgi:hypothetical protein
MKYNVLDEAKLKEISGGSFILTSVIFLAVAGLIGMAVFNAYRRYYSTGLKPIPFTILFT